MRATVNRQVAKLDFRRARRNYKSPNIYIAGALPSKRHKRAIQGGRGSRVRGVEGGTKVMQCRNMSRIKRGETGSALRRRPRRRLRSRSRRRFY